MGFYEVNMEDEIEYIYPYDEPYAKLSSKLVTHDQLRTLVENVEVFYKKCISGIVNDDEKKYRTNFDAMEQTYEVLEHLKSRRKKLEGIDIDEIEDKLISLQISRHNWNTSDLVK